MSSYGVTVRRLGCDGEFPFRISGLLREALAPLSWWLIGAAVALSLIVAIGAWTSLATGGIVAVIVVVVVVAAFIKAGSVRIVVTEEGFGVGRSWIEWHWVDRVRGMDAQTMNSVMRSSHQVGSFFLVTRPWIRSGSF